MPRVIIFDLDGTLLDTLEDLAAAVNHALTLRGLPTHSLEAYRAMVGHGVRDLVRRALPAELLGSLAAEDQDRLIDGALADFKAYYTTHIDVHTRPYPGMPELLKRLSDKGIALAVASNKFQAGTERLVAEFFPGIPFVAILGNRPGSPLKPDPAIVHTVLRSAGLPAPAEPCDPAGSAPGLRDQAVMVGDSRTDMLTAANGGIRGIAVSWGYRTLEPSPDYTLVSSVRELERALLTERHPFPPFLPENARILFLGSFPPQEHRWSMPFYYPNFQNDFWRILGLIFFDDPLHFVLPGRKRFDEDAIRAFCTVQGLAFYDTATEVIRLKDNASDAFLEVVTPTDIPALLAHLPHCRDIVVTGEIAALTLASALSCTPPAVGTSVPVTLPRPASAGNAAAVSAERPDAECATTDSEAIGKAAGAESSRTLRLWRMPSTSRAYPLPLDQKAEAYRKVLR